MEYKRTLFILITIAFLACLAIDAWFMSNHKDTDLIIGSGLGVISFKFYIESILKVAKGVTHEDKN